MNYAKLKNFGLIASMVIYVISVFYLSEPKYTDNNYKVPERYDYIHISESSTFGYSFRGENAIVMQVDSTNMLVKGGRYSDSFTDLKINSKNYRVVGRGTIYHKINDYVGFNIMIITQVIIGILLAVLMIRVCKIEI